MADEVYCPGAEYHGLGLTSTESGGDGVYRAYRWYILRVPCFVRKAMQQDLEQKIMNVIHEVLRLEPRDDLLDASLADDLSLSSLERMTLFIALEDEFDSNIPQEEVQHIDSIRSIVEFVQAKFGE